jgi:excisionase family DNA binding protein
MNILDDLLLRLTRIEGRLDQITNTNEPEYVGIEEACKLTSLTKSGIYQKTHRKEIPFYKNGKKLMFKRSDLIKFITRSPQKSYGFVIER